MEVPERPGPGGCRPGRKVVEHALGSFGAANLGGALVVFVYLNYLSQPVDTPDPGDDLAVPFFVGFMVVALVSGGWLGERRLRDVQRWLASGRRPTAEDVSRVLGLPWTLARQAAFFWVLAAVVFGVGEAVVGSPARSVARVAIGIVLGGLSTCALTYLLVERTMRPVTARALVEGRPERSRSVGARPRLVLAWALGSGIPLLGVALAPVTRGREDVADLAVLAAIGLLSGGLMTAIAVRSVTDRLEVVRAALARVRAGDVDVEVGVDEAGDVGLLQSGFNEMVAGLRERQRLADLFGRHVGDEVARRAMELGAGMDMGGEQREVSVLFVDLVGSTALAAERPAAEVVATLNALFGAVVTTASATGGWVDKFEGDGALCVFGAPADQPDHARRCLQMAAALREAVSVLRSEHAALDVGIGVSSGLVVAGYVGAEERYQYTVVGDPVNEAARLTEAAKHHPARLLVSSTTIEAAGESGETFRLWDSIPLRGRPLPTDAYEPVVPESTASRQR